jgi:hypothetical protein
MVSGSVWVYAPRLVRPTVQQARAALFVSICMTVLGTCGVGNGVAGANQTSLPAPPPPPAEGEPPRELDVFEAAQSAPLYEVLWESPYRRPIAGANVVVSAMLLVGSFLLTFRRPSALWWLRNAIAANVLWALVNFAHTAVRLLAPGPELYARMEAHARTYESLGDALDGRIVVIQAVVMAGVAAIVSAALHLAIAWRAHRPDIRAFIESGREE